jgi:hypothetical protein
MCATTEIWEACWHVSRPELHIRSCDLSRVDRSVSVRQNSMLNIPTALEKSHELTWREHSVSPAWGVLAREPTRPSRQITWLKQSWQKCESAPEFNVKYPNCTLTSHELTWREDSVSPALPAFQKTQFLQDHFTLKMESLRSSATSGDTV